MKIQVLQTMRPKSDCSKLAINRENENYVKICWHDVIIIFFLLCLVSLVKFSYWSKFHVNIITVSRVMTIFFYKGLTTNTPVWVLHNIWRLRQLKDTKFDTNVSNEMLLNSASQLLLSYSVIHLSFYLSFYCFSVIKGKPRERG